MKTAILLDIFGYIIIFRPLIVKLSLLISLIGLSTYFILKTKGRLANRLLVTFSLISFIPYVFSNIRFLSFNYMIILRFFMLRDPRTFIFLIKRLWVVQHDPLIWAAATALFVLVYKIMTSRERPRLKPLEDALLMNRILVLAKEMGVKEPEVFIADSKEVQVYTNAERSYSYIVISEGALAAFSQEELLAAVAHELAHIKNSDRSNLFLVFVSFIGTIFNFINIINPLLFKRESEYAADEAAAKVLGVEPLIKALVKASSVKVKWARGSGFIPSKFELLAFAPTARARIDRLLRLYKKGLLKKRNSELFSKLLL